MCKAIYTITLKHYLRSSVWGFVPSWVDFRNTKKIGDALINIGSNWLKLGITLSITLATCHTLNKKK